MGYFVDVYGGEYLDVSLLLLVDIGFIDVMDLCFVVIVDVVGWVFGCGDYLFCYIVLDDFGVLEISFNICMFWYIEVLVVIGWCEWVWVMFECMFV